MIVKLLTTQHLEFLSLKGGSRCSSESTLVKMPLCWKSHVVAHIYIYTYQFKYVFDFERVLLRTNNIRCG